MITVNEIHNSLKQKNYEKVYRLILSYGEADFFMNYTDFLKKVYPNDYSRRYGFFALITIQYHLRKEKRFPIR